MLIEWNKLNFRQRDNNLSHLYVMFTVDWNRQTDTPTGIASYQGAVSLSKLKADAPCTIVLNKGARLPGTNSCLQADNYGILFKDLYKHLNHLVDYITKAPPPQSLTDNYKNPYTGETTKEIIGKSDIETQTDHESKNAKKPVKKGFLAWVKGIFH